MAKTPGGRGRRRPVRRASRYVVAAHVARADGVEAREFRDEDARDVIRLVNATTSGWPYCRPMDAALMAHWKTLGNAYQPHNMLLARRGGRARAFVHGERFDSTHGIRFLAMECGALPEALRLVEEVERLARADGVERIVGPTCRSGKFYGGYVLGLEPYHPHWGIDITEVFVRAGFSVTQNECILAAESAPTPPGRPPEGYDIVEAETPPEFLAEAFRYAAVFEGKEVATCAARLYPKLMSPAGGPVGQIGGVSTNEAHRSRGLATLMTRMSLERLFGMGAGEVLISTGLDNPPALRAYEKAGFRRRHCVTEWTKALAR